MDTPQNENNSLTRRKKPPGRSGHIAVCSGQYMLVWGGYSNRVFPTNHLFLFEERYMDPTHVWIYDTANEVWYCKVTEGEVPPGMSGAAAVTNGNKLYTVGGHTSEGNISDVYELDLHTWTWSSLEVPDFSQKMSPRDKHVAWLHNNRIYVFGGYGPPLHGYIDENGHFMLDTGSDGISPNERAAHAVAVIGDIVYLFGGRHGASRLNDLYSLSLSDHHWSGRLLVTGDQPEGRSWQSLTPISERYIFMYGGYSSTGQPLSDAWLLDVDRLEWCQLHNIPADKPRLWHKACYTPEKDLLIFGGCANDILSNNESSEHTDSLLTYRFCPKSLLRLSLDSAFKYRDKLRSEWESLPYSLYDRLLEKLQSMEKDLQQGDDNDKAHTCCIS